MEKSIAQLKHEYTRLLASEKELKTKNKVRDKIFSIIAHDLKSPFNGLLGISNYLTANFNKFSSEELLKFIQLMNQSAKQLFDTVENLLEWSLTKMKGDEPKPEIINLKNMIDNAVSLLLNCAFHKNIKLITSIDSNIFAFADKNMLDCILRNLISNAIKFTHNEGTVEIKAEGKLSYVFVTITDTGIGINEKNMKDLFNARRTTNGTGNEKGSGLGLSLCKEFIEINGGDIWVESTVGEGTSFMFVLPLSHDKKVCQN